MALNQTTAPASGVWGAIKGALDIFSSVNKAEGTSENGNPVSIDEYESSMTEMDILDLISQWKKDYRHYYTSGVESSQTLSFEYWIGKQRSEEAEQVQGNQPLVDNKIFEAIETFIPIATRANPDPLVQADPGELGDKLSKDVKQVLVHEADRQKLRKILKGMLRHWLIYRIGILKVSYDMIHNEIVTEVINPKRMMFDKDGHWDEAGFFTGDWIAEKKQSSAKKLKEMFPKHKDEIDFKSQDKGGTKIEYIEWWYKNTDVFYTMDETVLGKYKNPHWNYDTPPVKAEFGEAGEVITPAQDMIEGKNHFKSIKSPYIGLAIFSTGLQPHDETSLILQNIGIQDMVNRRWRQIDRNVEGMNNGMVVDGVFTAEQASQAASALRRGTAIRVPTTDGNVNGHVARFPAPALPADVFRTLEDGRNELAGIFGTSGSTPQGIQDEKQVRGKILVNQMDTSRIGGGVTEYLEQIADTTYNFWVQMMFVHWSDTHYIISAGQTEGNELIQIKNTDLALVKTLDITVKEGSLIPKDPLTQRNEAIDLWSAQAIDPISFYKKLDTADPIQSATMLLTWQMVQKGTLPPQAYLPNFGQGNPAMQMPMQPQQGAPGASVNPPGGVEVNSGGKAGTPETPEASKSKQLLDSVPIK